MKRVLNHIRLFAVAVLALLALSVPSMSAHAGSVQCDKKMLSQAHNDATAAVGLLNYLDKQFNNSALHNALKEEKNVVKYTKDCNHLKKAFNNAYKASGDFYNFYYNVLPPNKYNGFAEGAKKNINDAYNLVEKVYGTAK